MNIALSIAICYITFIFEYFNLTKLNDEEFQIGKNMLVLLLFISLTNFLLQTIAPPIVKTTFSFISIYLINIYLIKTNEVKSIASAILYYVLLVCTELIVSIGLVYLLQINVIEYIFSFGITKCLVSIIISIILYFLCKIKYIKKLLGHIIKVIDKLKITTFMLSIFIMIICFVEIFYTFNLININSYSTIIFVLIFFVILISIFMTTYRNYYLRILNDFLTENDMQLQKLLNEYKMFKHNIKNGLLAVSSVGDKKVNKIIDSYMQEFMNEESEYVNIASLPSGLRGLLFQKLITYDKTNSRIIIDNYIKSDLINVLDVKKYTQFIQSFGIILDNAIENFNTKKDDNFIYIRLDENNSNYVIECINNGISDINLNNEGSTKDNHLGVGHKYIKSKTDFTFNIKLINGMYRVKLIVNK